jgi:hypothetical protein
MHQPRVVFLSWVSSPIAMTLSDGRDMVNVSGNRIMRINSADIERVLASISGWNERRRTGWMAASMMRHENVDAPFKAY